ncbi:hypothetical protein [Mycolicibacterium sediminis]|uniref:Uncharacterized protein n=1 Tax=Mycolicibacterium sediminis TaxID=1286180 RepID=A0A7I7QL02_9MYCO|nr:hypothetical protein [Mycolicibacterium sediminis]BBY26945.1 hypothetical protein MSEDJ_10410 [Mycolicibacterium sediminis]
MSGAPNARLEAIARLLGIDVGDLYGLESVPDDDLSLLHTQIGERLTADKRHRFARVAGLAQTIPGPIAGRLAEKFLPAKGAALAAELLEPAKARDLVGRVSLKYLGDLAVALDPVRAQDVIRAIPPARVAEVARELFDRKQYRAMARFTDSVEVDALFATLGVASPHDLLAVVPLLTWNDNLDRVIAELPEEQTRQIAEDLDAGELADLALALDPHRFGPIVAAVPVDTVADIAAALLERGEFAAMAGFAGVITPEMLNAAVDRASDGQLVDLLATMASGEMWVEFDHVADVVTDQGRRRLAVALDAMPAAASSRLDDAARAGRIGSAAMNLTKRTG